MERSKVNYWKWRLDSVVSDYKNWSLSVCQGLGRPLAATTAAQPVTYHSLTVVHSVNVVTRQCPWDDLD